MVSLFVLRGSSFGTRDFLQLKLSKLISSKQMMLLTKFLAKVCFILKEQHKTKDCIDRGDLGLLLLGCYAT